MFYDELAEDNHPAFIKYFLTKFSWGVGVLFKDAPLKSTVLSVI